MGARIAGERVTAIPSPLERLTASLAPRVVEALLELVDERVAALAGPTDQSTPWLSIAEAADYLRVSERTIERWIAERTSPLDDDRPATLLHRDDLDAVARAAAGEDVAPTTPPRRREE